MRGFKRVREQEGGNVRFWFEDDKGNVISLVGPAYGDPNSGVRVSYGDQRFEIPVSASLYEKLTVKQVLEAVEKAIDRRGRT